MKAKAVTAILFGLALGCHYIQADDSIPEKQLQEVTVLGDRAWVKDGVINIIPQKNEKKLSNSPASLIQMMHLPFLKSDGETIQNNLGEGVTIYINGEPAEQTDIKTFWPKECRRVEYMEYPSDPKYNGARAVVNFIVEKYVVGGVTSLDASQKFMNGGYYSAASKLVYKKMTYGVLAYAYYDRNPESKSTRRTDYKNLYYDGKYYDLISRNEESRYRERNDHADVALNARYTTNKLRITHNLSLAWDHDPGSLTTSTDEWTDNLFGSSSSFSRTKKRSLTPQFTGNYFFKLSDKWYLDSGFLTSYSHNNNTGTTRFGDSPEVINNTQEDSYRLRTYLRPYFAVSDNFSMQLNLDGNFMWYRTDYYGSTNTHEKLDRQLISGELNIYWNPRKNVRLAFSPGIKAVLWQVAGENYHQYNPNVSASASWSVNKKWYLSLRLSSYLSNPGTSAVNPVLVKTSPLMWTRGNPDLKAQSSHSFHLRASYFTNDWLSFGASFGGYRSNNEILNIYRAAPPQDGGLIQESVNAKPSDWLMGGIDVSLNLFDNNLSVEYGPAWDYEHVAGSHFNHVSAINHFFNASYTLKNFNFSLNFFTASKSLGQAGREKNKRNSSMDFWVKYGTGDLLVSAGVKNIFNKYRKSWGEYVSDYYCSSYHDYSNERKIIVSLSYTFGYGKKVDRSIDISGTQSIESSVRETTR